MKNLLTFLLSATLFIGNLQAANFQTAADGAWGNGATWTTTVPASNPTSQFDVITISHNVTLTGDLDVKGGTIINVASGFTLTINGDVTFQNNSEVNIEGTLVINGNVTNNNNSDEVVINGVISIDGNFDGGNGSGILGSGSMDITGTATTTGDGDIFGSTFDCTTPGDCSSSAAAPLPIELINWQGDNKNATNHFSWTTASEINNAYFSLERSFDTENWEVIAEINGAGNSNLFIQYEYNDSDYKNTINYYRLRQIDFDGNNETFKTIAINNTLNSTLEIVKIVNLMGQEVNNNYTGFRVVMYNDGSRELIKSYPQ